MTKWKCPLAGFAVSCANSGNVKDLLSGMSFVARSDTLVTLKRFTS